MTTNPEKTVLYIGVTNDLSRRLFEHTENKGNPKTFAGKYYCYNLVYFEHFTHIVFAIEREKQLKKLRREKKDALIDSFNPNWRFLNVDVSE
ncbi:GIY-YIG nuclease family protein [Mucilaginibacter sp.]|uniref:GIY-YIG nuclease family protein n=1 Tax=Mucilaginibacter sp. TaxID=1882438 RepID=UPI00261FBBBB|nr:GIY-YIG nuclease family protein [Mucilaginibacter sp.]